MWRYLINLYYGYMNRMENYPLDKAKKVIKYYESMHRVRDDGMVEAYWDDMGEVWTIGYGNTFYEDGTPVQEEDTITQERAKELLGVIIEDFREELLEVLKTRIDYNQFNALISFVWNVGISQLKSSTLLRKLNAGKKKEEVAAEFPRWNKSGGKVRRGLVRRRKTERILFETGDVVFPSVEDIQYNKK